MKVTVPESFEIAFFEKEFTISSVHGNPFKFKMTAVENQEGFLVINGKIRMKIKSSFEIKI